MKKSEVITIGIDPGVNTGYAVNDCGVLTVVNSVTIHIAMHGVRSEAERNIIKRVIVVFEDARQRKWFGNAGREQLQGAGSIKRDCKIWEDYLTDLKDMGLIMEFRMVAPKNNKTKLNSASFKKITGWQKQTNEHSRDAAMLVFGI